MAVYARRIGRYGEGQAVLVVLLLGLALVGWLVTDARMAGMDAGPGTDLGTLGFYTGAWVVMMAAMMFPSIVPMVLMYRTIERARRARGRRGSVCLFVAGYLASWTVFGLVAYALFESVRSLSIDALSWHRGGPYLAGGALVAAAIYQLTPAKDACLRRCRGPLQFLSHSWRDGIAGALRLGVQHGAWCVGCCWGLMVALFALGVMSIPWMILLAGLIALEKLLPSKTLANRFIAAVLVCLGLGVALIPHDVPGLTLPDSPASSARQVDSTLLPREVSMPMPVITTRLRAVPFSLTTSPIHRRRARPRP